MVTSYKLWDTESGNTRTVNYGTSEDAKPTNGRNGDAFIEMDTSKGYLYSDASETWVEYEGA